MSNYEMEGGVEGETVSSMMDGGGMTRETDWGVYHRKLFVGGISFATVTSAMQEYFSRWGALEDCVIMMDKHYKPPRSRGFGFITFENIESLERVMEKSDHVLDGRPIYLHRAQPHQLDVTPPKVIPNKVYISEITAQTTDNEIKELLEENFGPTTEVFVLKDHTTGESRKFGFGTFVNVDHATNAVQAGMLPLRDGVTIAKITKATAHEDTRRGGRGGRGYRGRGGGRFGSDYYGFRGGDYYDRGYGYGSRGFVRRGYPGGRGGGRPYGTPSGDHGYQYGGGPGGNGGYPPRGGGYGGGNWNGGYGADRGGRRHGDARNKSFNPY